MTETVPLSPLRSRIGDMDRRIEAPWYVKRAYRAGGGVAMLIVAGLVAWGLSPKAGSVNVRTESLTFGQVVRAPYLDYAPVRAEITPAQTTFVAAEASGRVESAAAGDGDRVTAGQILARLSNSQLSLDIAAREADISARISDNASRLMAIKAAQESREQALADAAHALNKARQELEKRQVLLAKDLLSAAAVQPYADEAAYQRQRLAALKAAGASDEAFYAAQRTQAAQTAEDLRRNLIEARAGRSALTIRAPASGRLTAFDLKPGQAVTLGQGLGQVDSEDAYKLRAQIDEFYLPRLAAGQGAEAVVHDRPVKVRVEKVFPQVANGRVAVDLVFVGPTPADLKRGEAIDLRLSLGKPQAAVIAPSGGWLSDTGGTWAFVLTSDGKRAERRPIVIGRRNPEQVEVLSGLRPGERIVTAGAQDLLKAKTLRLGSKG
ncbi:efflux RND transporter periplasmic adaptor subunit [Caulobacter sp. LARHSG274]